MQKKMKMIEKEIFICDICHSEHNSVYSATECEAKHKERLCQHANIKIDYDINWEGDGLKIEGRCLDCRKIINYKQNMLDKYDGTAPIVYSFLRERTDEEQKLIEAWMIRLNITPPITFDMIYAVIKYYEKLEAAIVLHVDQFVQDSIWEAMKNE